MRFPIFPPPLFFLPLHWFRCNFYEKRIVSVTMLVFQMSPINPAILLCLKLTPWAGNRGHVPLSCVGRAPSGGWAYVTESRGEKAVAMATRSSIVPLVYELHEAGGTRGLLSPSPPSSVDLVYRRGTRRVLLLDCTARLSH